MICKNCNKNFSGKRKTQKYCSRECQLESMRKQETRTCCNQSCFAEFTVRLSDKKIYCSRACSASVNNVKFPKRSVEGACLTCGDAIASRQKHCASHRPLMPESWTSEESELIKREWAVKYLVLKPKGSSRTNTNYLRKALLGIGRLYKCARCDLPPEWNGLPLLLDINHIDGNPINNVENNLEFLCPNCHRQELATNKRHSARPITVYPYHKA